MSKDPKTGDLDVRTRSPFVCREWCTSGGEWNRKAQARRECTRADYTGRWAAPESPKEIYLLREAHLLRAPTPSDPEPPEPIGDGCPAGWAICRFAESVAEYLPIGDMPSPLLTAQTDPLVIEAVRYYASLERRAIDRQTQAVKRGARALRGTG